MRCAMDKYKSLAKILRSKMETMAYISLVPRPSPLVYLRVITGGGEEGLGTRLGILHGVMQLPERG